MLLGGGVVPSMVFTRKVPSVVLVKMVCLWVQSDVFSGMEGRESCSV